MGNALRMVGIEKVTEESSDLLLAESFLAGNDVAFNWLFDRYIEQATSFAWRLCVDPVVADRVVMEAFARLRCRGWKLHGSFRLHLFSVCHNLSVAANKAPSIEVEAPAFGGASIGAHSLGGENVEQARIERALAKLPVQARSVLLLYYAHGLSPKEVARIVDVRPHQILSQIAGSRHLLRNGLKGEI